MSEQPPKGNGNTIGDSIDPALRAQLEAMAAENPDRDTSEVIVLDKKDFKPVSPPVLSLDEARAKLNQFDRSSVASVGAEEDAAWAAHNDQKSTEVPEPNPEVEKPLAEQCSDYLLEHRLLKKLDSVVDAKKRTYTASGGSQEDFNKTIWSQYRDALHEKGIIPDKDLGNFNPGLVREIIQGARQKSKELDSRKKDIAVALASNPELLKKISHGIDNDKNEYAKNNEGSIEGWDVRIAAQAEISPLLKQLGGASEYDAYLRPGDFTGVLKMAQETKEKQQSTKDESRIIGAESVDSKQNKNNKQLNEQIAFAAEQFVARDDFYTKQHRDAMGKARFEYSKQLLETLDPTISAEETNKILAEKWFKEGQYEAAPGVLKEIGLLPDVDIDDMDSDERYRMMKRFWRYRKDVLDRVKLEKTEEPAKGEVEPQPKRSLVEQYAAWERSRNALSNNPNIPKLSLQNKAEYQALLDMLRDPEALAELQREHQNLVSECYGENRDTDRAKQLRKEISASYHRKLELEALQLKALGVDDDIQPVKLPSDPLSGIQPVELPVDPLEDIQPVELPVEPLDADGSVLERLRRAHFESPSAETQKALEEYVTAHEKPATPITDIFAKAREEHVMEKTSEIRAQVAALQGESGVTYGERLEAALRNYAELKAIDETRNGDIKLFGRWTIYPGRAKREAKLKERENELFAAKMAYEQAVQAKMAEAKLYLGNEEQVKAQQRNDLLTRVRELDKATRDATNDALDAREAKGSFWRKAAVGIGNWLRGGNKVTKWLKAGGTGAGAVLLPTVMGAGWPITSTVALGASLATRYSVKTAALDEQRKASRRDRVMSDADFEQWRAASERNDDDSNFAATLIAKHIFNKSRSAGHERVDKANRETSAVMGKFAIGALAAGAARLGWEQLNNHNVAAAAGGDGHTRGVGKHVEPTNNGDGVEKLKGNTFTVEQGNGLNRELRQFAKLNGHDLTAAQADNLHHDLMERFGKDYIDIKGVKADIYTQGGDVRLSAPGKAAWDKGVSEFVANWLKRKGL